MEVDQEVSFSKIRNKNETLGSPKSSWSNIEAKYALYYTSGTLVPLTVVFGNKYEIFIKEIISYIFPNLTFNEAKAPEA